MKRILLLFLLSSFALNAMHEVPNAEPMRVLHVFARIVGGCNGKAARTLWYMHEKYSVDKDGNLFPIAINAESVDGVQEFNHALSKKDANSCLLQYRFGKKSNDGAIVYSTLHTASLPFNNGTILHQTPFFKLETTIMPLNQ